MPAHRRLLVIALVLLARASTAVASLAAQERPFPPAGARWSLRLDGGLVRTRVGTDPCDGCAEGRAAGAGARYAIGIVVHPRVVLGFEQVRQWRNSVLLTASSDNPPQVDIRAAVVYWYPPRAGTLNIRAAVGPARYRFVGGPVPGYGYGRRVELEGTGYGVEAAWDLWLWPGARLGLAPHVGWWRVPVARGSMRLPDRDRGPHRNAIVARQVGLGFTVR